MTIVILESWVMLSHVSSHVESCFKSCRVVLSHVSSHIESCWVMFQVMLSHVESCRVVLSHVESCWVVLSHVESCWAMLSHVESCWVMLSHVESCFKSCWVMLSQFPMYIIGFKWSGYWTQVVSLDSTLDILYSLSASYFVGLVKIVKTLVCIGWNLKSEVV